MPARTTLAVRSIYLVRMGVNQFEARMPSSRLRGAGDAPTAVGSLILQAPAFFGIAAGHQREQPDVLGQRIIDQEPGVATTDIRIIPRTDPAIE